MITRQVTGVFRAARVTLHLGYGLAIALIYPRLDATVQQRILQHWSAELLEIINVQVTVEDQHACSTSTGMVVTNHISWLDVFILNAVVPMRFVAKSEVRRWPLIGWLCARTQTLFIERGKARDAARINKRLVELLRTGESLAVFPEGTTTDGTQVNNFHASLLQPAIDADSRIHPMAIRYQDAHGAHSLAAAYIDDLTLSDSLWNILTCRSLHVRLVPTPPLTASNSDRRTLARKAHQQISAAVAAMQLSPSVDLQQTPVASFQSFYAMLLVPPIDRPAVTTID